LNVTHPISDDDGGKEATMILVLGVKLASAVLLIVYFGLSRLLHEYVCTMLLAVILSLIVILKVAEKARRIRRYPHKDWKDF